LLLRRTDQESGRFKLENFKDKRIMVMDRERSLLIASDQNKLNFGFIGFWCTYYYDDTDCLGNLIKGELRKT